MRIAVLGGCGFVGSHVVDLLVAGGHEVEVLDDLSSCWLGPLDGPRFVNPDAIYSEVDSSVFGNVIQPEVIVDAALRHPLERELAMYRFCIDRVGRAANLVMDGALCKTLKRYVVVSSLEVAADRPRILARHLRAFSETLAYLHRPPEFDVEFVHLPELYGPRQLPGTGDVAAALAGGPGTDVAPTFGHLGYVLDAARLVVARAIDTSHRRSMDLFVSAPIVDAEILSKFLGVMGRDEEAARALDVRRPSEKYCGNADVELVETALVDGLERTIEFYDRVSAEEEAGR